MNPAPPLTDVRIGTRASPLALAQAQIVAAALRKLGVACRLVTITTAGDRFRRPLSQSPAPGLFVREIEGALEQHRVDLAVHSLKDLPEPILPQFTIAAILRRSDPRDAFICPRGFTLKTLPRAARVGTSSPRRQAQLLRARPDLEIIPARGNVDTRLRKLDSGAYDALVAASAGLIRLGLAHRITERLPINRFIPAPGQGAIAVEVNRTDRRLRRIAALLDHPPSRAAVAAERSCMCALQAGCNLPLGALARLRRDALHLTAEVLSPDGRSHLRVTQQGPAQHARAIGQKAARMIIRQGGTSL